MRGEPQRRGGERKFLALFFAIGLTACATPLERVEGLAAAAGLGRVPIEAAGFRLLALERAQVVGDAVHIYIDGDGRPWVAGGHEVAADPTSRRTPALDWMQADPRGVLYLGRPCYFGHARDAGCSPGLWTSGRYSERVVAAMAAALDGWLARREEIRRVTLVGHSGGGVIALLVAERVAAVGRVVAVAAPVDHRRWTALHGYTPLLNSLNPAEVRAWRAGVRRIFVFGAGDANVPPREFAGVAERIPGSRVLTLAGIGHDGEDAGLRSELQRILLAD